MISNEQRTKVSRDALDLVAALRGIDLSGC